MVLTPLVCLAVWTALSIVLGALLAAVIGHADRCERAEVARWAAAARASEPAAASGSGTR